MSDCQFQSRVEAYHDGELSPDGRRAVEEHVAQCEVCAAELAWLRSVSQSLGQRRGADVMPAELRRVHAAVAAAAGESEGSGYPISLYRTAGVLMAIAASVLIVSCVWLNDLPSRPGPTRSVGVAEGPPWERVAMTLRADPLPTGVGNEAYLADARLADWMLRGLGAGGADGRMDVRHDGSGTHEGP